MAFFKIDGYRNVPFSGSFGRPFVQIHIVRLTRSRMNCLQGVIDVLHIAGPRVQHLRRRLTADTRQQPENIARRARLLVMPTS